MTEQIKQVEEFHNKFNIENGIAPRLLDIDAYRLRFNLMDEENKEYLDACVKDNLVEIADALGDKLYILCGTILRHGMQHKIVEVFNEIQRSNMSKLGDDGNPVVRTDGKIIKGPNYSKPNIKPILEL